MTNRIAAAPEDEELPPMVVAPRPERGGGGRVGDRVFAAIAAGSGGLIVVLVALVAGLLYGALTTERGTAYAWRAAVKLLDGRLAGTLDGGTIATGVRLRHVAWHGADGTAVTVDRISGQWALSPRPWRFVVDYLHIGDVDLRMVPSAEASTPMTMPTDLRLRYEVWRTGGHQGKDSWVRRYEEIGPDGQLGAVWCKRFVVPGQDGYLSRFRQDRFVFDEKSHSYVLDPGGSAQELRTYLTVTRASNNWGRNNQTLFDLSDCIRLTSEWQDQGKIFETYDYARGKGLVAWRWMERLSTLRPMEGDATGTVFHCEEGFVQVAARGDEAFRPTVYTYNPKTGQRGAALEMVKFKSHWRPELGDQWYVVFRDTTREKPLVRKPGRVEHDFSLPEWEGKPGATIRDLPYKHTTPLPSSKR